MPPKGCDLLCVGALETPFFELARTRADESRCAHPQAAAKILPHLVSLLKPYTTSITASLPALHTRLLALKPLFDFLRRHAARQAHEFQKAYVQTVRWYLETAFRRYVRALEKIRTAKAQTATDPIGVVNAGVDASLGEVSAVRLRSVFNSRFGLVAQHSCNNGSRVCPQVERGRAAPPGRSTTRRESRSTTRELTGRT